ncbi:nuclear transport factor 2 family protein [Pseudomonas sp. TCU-HL1]|uniref:nuclear transport factor 2 family protein n=1 Tax=Pseudomonas sp. TCU-HL1 TaxID=1856685 RepID=UPI00083DEFA4|nr:nuclear transport factor 2 family protein [Pseudomonas sp. TCU-HL1]AOE87377.1 transcriptional regulator [Pseudomonas sp. TCU-HL1]
MNDYLGAFATRFARLDRHNLALLRELYSDDVRFTDPLHQVEGLPALQRYFEAMYADLHELQFDFLGRDQVGEGEGYLRWRMAFRHPRLSRGRAICLEGCSHLRWRDKVHWHRDYFDAGALLYEHVPLLGGAIRWLKRRLA